MKIVKNAKPHSEHFLCLYQVTDIASCIVLAGRTLTSLLKRSVILFKLLIIKVKNTDVCEKICAFLKPEELKALMQVDIEYTEEAGKLYDKI